MAIGRWAFRLLANNEGLSFLEALFINFGLGAGSLSLAVLYIGLAGLLYRWVVIAMLAVLAILLRKDIDVIIRGIISWVRSIIRVKILPFERLLILFIAVVWSLTLIGSLSPVLGGDAVSYHMRDAKLFTEAHKVMHIPYTRDSLWPFLVQMLFTLGLLLKGVVLAKLFHFVFGLFSIIGVYVLCRRYWPRVNSLFTCAVLALIPAFFTGSTYAYTDMANVFYTIFAFYAFFRWLDKRSKRWFIFQGYLVDSLWALRL